MIPFLGFFAHSRSLPENRVLVVLITSGNLTRDKVVRPERVFGQEDLDLVANYLNRHYKGWTLEAMRTDLRAQVERDREQYGRLAGDALLRPESIPPTHKSQHQNKNDDRNNADAPLPLFFRMVLFRV